MDENQGEGVMVRDCDVIVSDRTDLKGLLLLNEVPMGVILPPFNCAQI